MRRISIFGATGSVGEQTVDLIRRAGGAETHQLVALTGGWNVARLGVHVSAIVVELNVEPEAALAGIQVMFETAYRQRFAFLMMGKALVIEAVSVARTVLRLRRPWDESQMDACNAPATTANPTMIEPSPEMPRPSLWLPPDRNPSATIPVALVHR